MPNTIDGFLIGNAQDEKNLTGATVIICKDGMVAGVDVRGGSPGTRETDLLNPVNTVDKVHAVVLSGGSAFGLAASSGVMKYLYENGVGFDTGFVKVPIVCQCVLYDLPVGEKFAFPDEKMGFIACENAGNSFEVGNFGAGTGATIGKIKGNPYTMKSGLGYAKLFTQNGIEVAAIVAVNALGDVYENSKIIAGCLGEDKRTFADTNKILINLKQEKKWSGENTTIGAIMTNASLTKPQMQKVAQMAHDGYARAISPVHTTLDGDTIFALSTAKVEGSVDIVGQLGALAMQQAIVNAVKSAKSVENFISYSDLISKQ
ncbi:P1 family peptidase [Criibacterium bergeronii]|uniref:Peptidase S58 family protein n=1 Tax=Criibacterium bergeronii TaxID=1871336 RepID=A0A371ILL1_9FIRM|nr:P1 family peptidase [Criibacterium bergeronii]MBS6062791.1 P1 family peptidase [Peptostreptococcaceae bacterium]RDY21371.1 peptidase S58 family protein [Criibacterium bergeronii]